MSKHGVVASVSRFDRVSVGQCSQSGSQSESLSLSLSVSFLVWTRGGGKERKKQHILWLVARTPSHFKRARIHVFSRGMVACCRLRQEAWLDGAIFAGQYVAGMKSGQGKFTWADGAFYEGGFEVLLLPQDSVAVSHQDVLLAIGTTHVISFGLTDQLVSVVF